MPKINIFPLNVRDDLVQVAVYNISEEHGLAPFFDTFRKHGVRLKFFSHIGRENDRGDISFCLEKDDFRRAKNDLQGLINSGVGLQMAVRSPVAIIRILGPHFDIRTRISGLIYNALVERGVEVLGNSTTITTCLLVVVQEDASTALKALRRFFNDKVKKG